MLGYANASLFLHSLGHCKCICLSTFGLSSFKEFARVIPPQNPSSKDPQKIPKRPSGDPSPGNPSTFFHMLTQWGALAPKKEKRDNSGYLTEKDLLLANTPLLFLKCGRVFLVVAYARVFRKRPEDAHNTLNQRVYFSFRQSRRTFHLLYHASQDPPFPINPLAEDGKEVSSRRKYWRLHFLAAGKAPSLLQPTKDISATGHRSPTLH